MTVIGIMISPEVRTPQQTAAEIREQMRVQIEQAREQALQAAEQARASAAPAIAAVQEPVIVVPSRGPVATDMAPRVQEVWLAGFFTLAFLVVAVPIARAIARWLDRRHTPVSVPPELSAQLSRMETTIEAMQIEVERIAEAQRFMSRIVAGQGEAVPEARRQLR